MAHRGEGKHSDELSFIASAGTSLRLRNRPRAVFDPAVRSARLDAFTPQDLRHTAASLAVSSGASVRSVQRVLGAASAAMPLDVDSGLFDDLTALASGWTPPLGQPPTEHTARSKRPGQPCGPRGDRTHNPRIKSSPDTLF
jgi:hypothetical protein